MAIVDAGIVITVQYKDNDQLTNLKGDLPTCR